MTLMHEYILRRLDNLPMLPESQAALAWLVEHDWNVEEVAQEQARSRAVMERIYHALSGDVTEFQPFLLAWLTLRVALSRLDHLQDDENTNSTPLAATASVGEQYNLVFTYYVLAASLLDTLDDTSIPPGRLRRLSRLWNDSMLWAASGQQRDLGRSRPAGHVDALLEHYQAAIEAKAGALYALAFAGTASLATDDPQIIAALSLIGQIYGVLLQFSDDILDAEAQKESALTLPQVYTAVHDVSGLTLPAHQLKHYWNYVYTKYFEQMHSTLAGLPMDVQAAVLDLFRSTFGS